MTGIERIEEIRARLAKATPSTVLFSPWGESDAYRDTVHFFSRSDTDIRDLLAEVERLRERAVKLEGLLSEALDDAPGWILDAEAALE